VSKPPPVPDRDTILTTVYCLIDDLYQQQWADRVRRRRAGQFAPTVSDSEVLALMVLGQWQPDRSERAFLRYAARHWRAYFPRQLSQSAFNRRARDLWGVLAALGPAVAHHVQAALGLPHEYEVIDGVPMPFVRRCRGDRHGLRGLVGGFGRGGADKTLYYGGKLLLSVSPTPLIRGAVLGPANTEERWLLDALLTWRWDPTLPLATPEDLVTALGPTHHGGGQRQGPTGWLGPRYAAGAPASGPQYGDLAYAGTAWQRYWQMAYGQTVATKAEVRARPGATRADGRTVNGRRQVVERVNGLLEAILGLPFPRARTVSGLWARLGAKLAAFNCLVTLNLLHQRPPESPWSPLD
jgi:hypothetical protein